MSVRRIVPWAVWAVLTAAATVWLLVGNFHSEFGAVVTIVVAASVAYGPARAIALWRRSRADKVTPRILPLRICLVITGLITFGPLIAAMAGWVGILPAMGCFLGGVVLMSIAIALFSDGYQGLWLDALIFHGALAPPEEDWVTKKR